MVSYLFLTFFTDNNSITLSRVVSCKHRWWEGYRIIISWNIIDNKLVLDILVYVNCNDASSITRIFLRLF